MNTQLPSLREGTYARDALKNRSNLCLYKLSEKGRDYNLI